MGQLERKVAIVTGATSGIGRAAARLFAAEGAKVVATGRRQAELDALLAEIRSAGGEAAAIAGDIRNEALSAALVDLAVERFGGLDIAFNNAGATGAVAPTPEIDANAWRETIETNLTSAFLCARRQIPAMIERGGGALLFTSTFVGHTVGFQGLAAYAAAKAGLIGLTQVIAAEFGGAGVRANALLPGGTDTPMGRQVASTPESRTYIEGLHALRRLATPEEIARSALHLVSEASSFMTGTAVLVDGGFSIYRG